MRKGQKSLEEQFEAISTLNWVVQQILDGFTRREVVLSLKNGKCPYASDGMSERSAYNYHQRAVDAMDTDVEALQEHLVSDLITKYLYLYKRSVARDNQQADWLAKAALDSLAKLLKLEDKVVTEDLTLDSDALKEEIKKLADSVQFKPVFESMLKLDSDN